MPAIYYLRRLIEVFMPITFLIGVFIGSEILWFIAGLIMAIEDILSMLSGELKPTFPIIVATIGAVIINPWYLGIFWSIEIFALLGVPTSFIALFSKEVQERDQYHNEMERIKDQLIKFK